MKALFCGYCMTIAGLGQGTEEVTCHCRATVRPDEYGPRCRGRWVDPQRGTAIFAEIAHGGNEREFPASNSGRCHARGTAIGEPKALYVLGIHNTLLTHRGHSLDHAAVAAASGRSLFAVKESLIVRFRPGESGDTAYVSLADFEAGRFPDDPLPSLPEDQRVYRAEPSLVRIHNPRTGAYVETRCEGRCYCHHYGVEFAGSDDGTCSECGCPRTLEAWERANACPNCESPMVNGHCEDCQAWGEAAPADDREGRA